MKLKKQKSATAEITAKEDKIDIFGAQMTQSHHGIRQYYVSKIEELQFVIAQTTHNLRRLEAQRNQLNAKGAFCRICESFVAVVHIHFANCWPDFVM